MNRTNYLLGPSYGPGVTRMDKRPLGMNSVKRAAEGQPRTGPVVSNDIPFTLVASAASFNLAAANPNRIGMMLQNKDVAANLFFRFGGPADATSMQLAPGQVLLLDFVCPTSSVWVFATAAVSGAFSDMSRLSE